MTRRGVLLGAGAAGLAAAVGVAWSIRRGVSAWSEAQAVLRRPVVPGLMGRAAREELVRLATLAANSHNTQPWRFEIGEDAIAVRPDFSRRCPVVDPDDHHLFASLGAAAENIVQAAPVMGLEATLLFEPQGDGRVVVALRAGPVWQVPFCCGNARVGRMTGGRWRRTGCGRWRRPGVAMGWRFG
jgi:hypothetical protein